MVVEQANLKEVLLRHGADAGSELWRRAGNDENKAAILGPLADMAAEVFLYSDFALAILIRNADLNEIEKAKHAEKLLIRLQLVVDRAWPDYRPLFRCAVVDVSAEILGEQAVIPYGAITLALNSVKTGAAYFNELLREDSEVDHFILARLDTWKETGSPPLFYQPKVRLSDNLLVGGEGLLRMTDASGQAISPMRAISLFRARGRLHEFEWVTIAAAIRFLKLLPPERGEIVLAVNISASSLSRPDFAASVINHLRIESVPANRLCLEIVEWSELSDRSEIDINLQLLIAVGVQISLDDFGVGYSTLLLLTQFEIAEVKIDQTMISNLADLRSRSIISFIVDAAHRCGARVTAEGIEAPGEAAVLRAMGVDVVQGHLYAPALPAAEFAHYNYRGD